MSFLDELSEYLRGLEPRSPGARALAPVAIDPATVRMQFLDALEHWERLPSTSPSAIDELLRNWQEEERVVRFGHRLAQLLRQSFGKDASPSEIHGWIGIAIARFLKLPEELPSRVRTLELDRLSEAARTYVFRTQPEHGAPKVDGYATAIRAAHPTEGVTPIGRVFLELTGRDAVRWLLHVETAQSTGPADPWRVSRETAQALVHQPQWTFPWDDEDRAFPHSWETLRRLEHLGLVSIESPREAETTFLETLPLGRELLAEVEKETDSPMSILAHSLLADLTLSTVDSVRQQSARGEAAAHTSAAAEATARQARMVAHEVHNALVPTKTALGALYREILLEPPSEVLARRRESIDRGIETAFRFVDQLVQISRLAATPAEPFDPLSALRDAVASIEAETGQHIEQELPTALPLVSGHRARMVLALSNVLRNATQAVTEQALRIRLQAESIEGGRAVRITVEDNGPGVPETMRQAIFDEGISLRPGGSGLGLALVREVFEKEMKGLVGCDTSPLGGARFVLRVPTTGLERP